MIKINQATKTGYIECCDDGVADFSYPNSKLRRGRVQDGGQICPTITSESCGLHRIETINNNKNIESDKNIMDIDGKKYRIRKLTENECWKLMGMTSNDCNKCKDVGISKTQLYKQAGNGLVTNCIQLLFEHLYKAQYNSYYKCMDEKILSENISIENFI